MIDWVEGHQKVRELTGKMYEAMLVGDFQKAIEICDEMIVEVRLTRAQIGAQHEDQ